MGHFLFCNIISPDLIYLGILKLLIPVEFVLNRVDPRDVD